MITELLDRIHLSAGVGPASTRWLRHRNRLADELELVWLLKGRAETPWARPQHQPPRHNPSKASVVVGNRIDGRDEQLLVWLVSERRFHASGDIQSQGCGTCPREAVLPWTLHLGLPSPPAHLCGGSHPGQEVDVALRQWALLAACLDRQRQGLRVGLTELALSLM